MECLPPRSPQRGEIIKCISDMFSPAEAFHALPPHVQDVVIWKFIAWFCQFAETDSGGSRVGDDHSWFGTIIRVLWPALDSSAILFKVFYMCLLELRFPFNAAVVPLWSPARFVPPGSTLQFVPGLLHLANHCKIIFLLKRKEILAENFSECSLSMGAECASLVSRWFLLTENYVFLFPAPWWLPWGQCWSTKRRIHEFSFCN